MYLLDTLLRTRENKEENSLVVFYSSLWSGGGDATEGKQDPSLSKKNQWLCQSIRTFLNLQICLILTVDHSHMFSVKSSSVKLKNLNS